MMVAILILVTPYVKSFILWAFIIFLQCVCVIVHIFRVYEKIINYVLVMI